MIAFGTAHIARADRLSSALRKFHKALIEAEIGDHPDLGNPYTALFAAIGDPRFSWMGRLPGLIVRIDESVDDGTVGVDGVLDAFVDEAAALIAEGRAESDPVFRLRHLIALQNEPAVGIATGSLRSVIRQVAVAA